MSKQQRESFVFYRSFFEAIEEVEAEHQLPIYRGIAMYALDKKEPELTGFAKVLWKLIKPQIDANWVRFENGCKGGEHGSKGGAPMGNKNAEKKQPQNNPKTTPNVNVNVNDNKESTNVPKKNFSLSIEKRKENFLEEIRLNASDYPPEMLNQFFAYWTEKKQNGKKMRFEMEKTWETKKRLARWRREY